VIRVVLLGDVRLHREGIAALLAEDGRLRVVALAPTAGGLPRWTTPPDVIVVASAHDQPESLQRLADEAREPIVALGIPDAEDDVIAFAESGVLGFVEREASLDELVATVLSAARREASFPPRIATMLLRRVSSLATRQVPAAVTDLTVRERQVVQLIAEGMSNKEIATRLCIEVATVKNHVHNILEKLQVSRRLDAVARLRIVEGGGLDPTIFPISEARSSTRSTVG